MTVATDWEALTAETTDHLRNLVRIDTTNPPGNETAACQYLARALEAEGIESTILESAPGRGNLVARLRGDGSARPLLLLSHLDVVPAEPSYWSADPFAGDVRDGFVWGRGTVDTKNLTAWQLACVLHLKRSGVRLNRDVIFAATADEEAGGAMGVGWLVKHHPDLLDAEYGINEGGGYGIEVGSRRFFTCQTAEKGLCRLVLRARGAAGHGAVPHRDNAVVHLAEAVARVGLTDLPTHRTPTTEQFVDALASGLSPDDQATLRRVWEPDGWAAVETLSLGPALLRQLRSTVRNTATPTILQAGTAVNVVPTEAIARLDGRILPGQTPEGFRDEVQAVVGERVQVEIAETSPSEESAPSGPVYDTVRAVLREQDSEADLVPLMSLGATDSRYLRARGVQMYGLKPTRSEPGAEANVLMHNHDERISLANVAFGLKVLWEVVARTAGARSE